MITPNPFDGPGPAEVHLSRAPLVNVLCQIRFPAIASLERKEFVAPFQEAVRHQYPTLVLDQGIELSFTPQGGGFSHKVIWRMIDKSETWRVSVGDNFLSLETKAYPGRTRFLDALTYLVEKMQATVQPDQVERIGLRYINRLVFTDWNHLSRLVQPGVLGIVQSTLSGHLKSTVSESRFRISQDTTVNGKWGLLPENESYDPTVLPGISQTSWILDIDGVSDSRVDFHPDAIMPVVNHLADTDYRLFRFAVTDTLLQEYGGTA